MTSRPRRIAIVSDAIHPYNKGGKEMRIHELSTRLAAQGHDVHIYTMRWWEGPATRTEHGVHLHAISRLYPLYAGERRSIKEGIMFALACLKLIREDFDVVEVDHMPFFPLYTVKIVSLLKRKPMYATWHEVWGRQYWGEYLGKLGLIAYLIEKFSVYLPNHIFAVSPLTATRLVQDLHYRGPITLATNGIDVAKIAAAEPSAETSDIIFVGRLLEHKNVDLLIRAVAILKKSRPDIRCIIISDGPERPKLERLTKEFGVEDNVVFKGFVKSDNDKLRLLKASKVFVLPSTREGFGIVALEAMACGLPVVTVDHADNATKDLVTSATGRLSAANPNALAVAINELFAQDASKALEVAAENYDWTYSALAVSSVYAK